MVGVAEPALVVVEGLAMEPVVVEELAMEPVVARVGLVVEFASLLGASCGVGLLHLWV